MDEIREIPTFFGPPEAPMFGVLHVPAESRVRGGVLVCASIGKDASDSINTQRLIADGLAQSGAAVLRFDYLGCGDSSYEDSRPTAVEEWLASIDHAASYLRGAMGVDDLSIIALRAGCLIAAAAMNRYEGLRSAKRVVFVDPVGTGKRFLREQTTFFKMAGGGNGAAQHDGVSLIGTQLSARAADELRVLSLWPDGECAERSDVFVVGRRHGSDAVVTALVEHLQPNTFLSDRLIDAAQPTRLLAPTPLDAVDAVVDWLCSRLPGQRTPFQPLLADRARVADGVGGFVVERIERVNPRGLFAIRTMPDGHDPSLPLPTVMFFTNAVNPHHGPNRAWVAMARAAARHGHQGFRWDRFKAGESGPARRDDVVFIYSQEGIDDAVAATRHAKESASTLLLVGLCSGAWFAGHGARTVGADSLALVNVLLWSWRVKRPLRQAIAAGDDDVAGWEQSRRSRLRRHAQEKLPAFAWRALGRTGAVQAPENLLSSFARQGTAVTAILCPDDAKLFYANRGGEALDRLSRTPAPPTLIETTSGDHAAFHPVVLGPLAACILQTLDTDARVSR